MAFVDIAKQFNISPAKLALGWCNQVEGITSTIIGATTMTQLEQNIDAFAQPLSQPVLDAVNEVINQYPTPY